MSQVPMSDDAVDFFCQMEEVATLLECDGPFLVLAHHPSKPDMAYLFSWFDMTEPMGFNIWNIIPVPRVELRRYLENQTTLLSLYQNAPYLWQFLQADGPLVNPDYVRVIGFDQLDSLGTPTKDSFLHPPEDVPYDWGEPINTLYGLEGPKADPVPVSTPPLLPQAHRATLRELYAKIGEWIEAGEGDRLVAGTGTFGHLRGIHPERDLKLETNKTGDKFFLIEPNGAYY